MATGRMCPELETSALRTEFHSSDAFTHDQQTNNTADFIYSSGHHVSLTPGKDPCLPHEFPLKVDGIPCSTGGTFRGVGTRCSVTYDKKQPLLIASRQKGEGTGRNRVVSERNGTVEEKFRNPNSNPNPKL